MSRGNQPAQILVRNLQRAVPINAASLGDFARQALPLCLKARKAKGTALVKLREIFVLIISDRRMASLHRQFLNEIGPTDVITFAHGEIFISAETARRHARAFRNSMEQELRLYIVHGLLHLHGFDDRSKIAAHKMETAQLRILREVSGN